MSTPDDSPATTAVPPESKDNAPNGPDTGVSVTVDSHGHLKNIEANVPGSGDKSDPAHWEPNNDHPKPDTGWTPGHDPSPHFGPPADFNPSDLPAYMQLPAPEPGLHMHQPAAHEPYLHLDGVTAPLDDGLLSLDPGLPASFETAPPAPEIPAYEPSSYAPEPEPPME